MQSLASGAGPAAGVLAKTVPEEHAGHLRPRLKSGTPGAQRSQSHQKRFVSLSSIRLAGADCSRPLSGR